MLCPLTSVAGVQFLASASELACGHLVGQVGLCLSILVSLHCKDHRNDLSFVNKKDL